MTKSIKRLLLLSLLLSTVLTTVAATGKTAADDNKLSISTQMFLDELKGEMVFDATPASRLSLPGQPRLLKAVDD